MVDALVVVNGIPGSGKTTLAAPLAARLRVPLIAKDAIKEALSDVVGAGLPTSALGGLATDVLWRLAGLCRGTVMVESFWAAGRDEEFFRRGYASLGSPAGVEVWCTVPVAVAAQRCTTRPRHAAHDDDGRVEQMRALARGAAPISGLPVIEVDTRAAVDAAALAARIDDALRRSSA